MYNTNFKLWCVCVCVYELAAVRDPLIEKHYFITL
jgi:hypothetical protein